MDFQRMICCEESHLSPWKKLPYTSTIMSSFQSQQSEWGWGTSAEPLIHTCVNILGLMNCLFTNPERIAVLWG